MKSLRFTAITAAAALSFVATGAQAITFSSPCGLYSDEANETVRVRIGDADLHSVVQALQAYGWSRGLSFDYSAAMEQKFEMTLPPGMRWWAITYTSDENPSDYLRLALNDFPKNKGLQLMGSWCRATAEGEGRWKDFVAAIDALPGVELVK